VHFTPHTSIGINPDWAGAHSNLGAALAVGGDYSGAVDQYREALRLDPYDESARVGLQRVLPHVTDVKPGLGAAPLR